MKSKKITSWILGIAIASAIVGYSGKVALNRLERYGNLGMAKTTAFSIYLAALVHTRECDGKTVTMEDLIKDGVVDDSWFTTPDGKPACRAIEYPRIATPPGSILSEFPGDTVFVHWRWDEETAVRVTVDGQRFP